MTPTPQRTQLYIRIVDHLSCQADIWGESALPWYVYRMKMTQSNLGIVDQVKSSRIRPNFLVFVRCSSAPDLQENSCAHPRLRST